MKISDLTIRNFKAIREIHLSDLGDVVVVAGPNGCGKSCILDGIRLLKSVYAGYRHQNEWQQFFGEFQLNIQNAEEVRRVFFNKKLPIVIAANFQLSEKEKNYVKQNVARLVQNALWVQRFGPGPLLQFTAGNHPGFEEAKEKLAEAAKDFAEAIIQQIDEPFQRAQVTLKETIEISTEPNAVLQFIFGIYDPANIGIIDYHSANRTYQRERLGGINVNIEETSEKLAQHALYNWQNKYTNIKSELAAAYIRDLFVERSGGEEIVIPSILSTMRQLTKRLFPEFSQRINALSGDNKFGVRQLYAALEKAVVQMKLSVEIYAIFDRDSELETRPPLARAFNWNVYHIENYLLEETYILKVMKDNPTFAKNSMNIEQIREAIKECAKDSLHSLVEHRMRALINTRLMKCFNLNYNPEIKDPAKGFGDAITRVMSSVQKAGAADLNEDSLALMRSEIENELIQALDSEKWRSEFRGRDILKRFSGKYLNGLPYEAFRDSIIARMGDDGYQPPGMKVIVDQVAGS